MTQSQQQELTRLTNLFRTVGLDAAGLRRKKALEAKRASELAAHCDQLNTWALRFRVTAF